MKKRTKHIIIAIIAFLLLACFELYILSRSNSTYNPIRVLVGMILSSSTFLAAAVAAVAAHDANNLRSRTEIPLDAVMVKGFRVQEKKCTFGEENTVLLCLAHCSKNAYTVTVTVTYLNTAGRILGQESQTVTGFVRGMEKYLCFRPGRDFHTFSYTLETALFHGVSAEKNFRFDGFQVKPLYGTKEEEKPRKGIYPVQLHVTEEYVGTREVEVSCTYVLLDKENTVHGICTPPPRRLTEPVPAHTFPAAEFSYLSKGEIPLDEELPKEGVKGICVYTVTPV